MSAERVLIVKPSSLGDIVHSLPFLAALRRKLPEAQITWLVGRASVNLLEGHPALDALMVFERERWGDVGRLPGSLCEVISFARDLRRRRFDLVIDLQGLFRSGALTWLTGAPRRVGFENAREWAHVFYNERVKVPDGEIHAVARCLLVAKALGCNVSGVPAFEVAVGEAARARADKLLARANPEGKRVVAVLPSARWSTKRWPADYFSELANRVSVSLDAHIIFLGARDDRGLIQRITGRMKNAAANLAGETTLKESAALMERAAVVIANDSGPMHLAVALGRPTVALYGPTSPERTGPYGDSARVLWSRRPCVPCFKSECDDVDCMRDIMPAAVFEVVREMMHDGG
jgi:lipopolysaccharide heptosyltransferase I